MIYKRVVIAIFVALICGTLYAEDVKSVEEKPKSLDLVSDTAVTVLKKVNAFFTGNLEWTMPAGGDKYKNYYTVNALGQKVPDSTLKKYDSGNR